MKVGVVGEIHPSGYEIFDKNNIEYFVTNNINEDHLIEKLQDVDGIVAVSYTHLTLPTSHCV